MTLTAVVSRLAATHAETITVNGETHKVTRRALLTDLEHAGTASTASRSGSTPGPKIPIDGDAVDLARRIRRDLTVDLLRLGATRLRFGPLATVLTNWHAMFQASDAGGAEHAAWATQLTTWEGEIRALIEPEKRMPVIGHPCPICGHTRAKEGDDSTVALWIAFHEDAPEATTRLECRACREVLAAGSKAAAATLRINATSKAGTC